MSTDKPVQIIESPQGDAAFAAVPIETYRVMVRDLQAYRDLKTGVSELQALEGGDAVLPADVAHRIADGDNPVRVWREHRGHKAVALARMAGISPAYLSEIETGKKEGTFRTMAALARHLDISLDDLAPMADDQDADSLRRAGREAAFKAEIAGIRASISSGAFDSGAVRKAAARLERDMDAMVSDGAEPIWASKLTTALSEIVALVDQAEQDIVATARTAQSRLEDIISNDAFAIATKSRARKPSAPEPNKDNTAPVVSPTAQQIAGE